MQASKGLILMNLGTPETLSRASIRSYLKEFLMDPFVIDIPRLFRWVLVKGIIAPLRPKKAFKAYASIWTPQGSPLKVHHEALSAAVGRLLEPHFWVRPAMRYGANSLLANLKAMEAQGIRDILLFPLYPQFAWASTESTLSHVKDLQKRFAWVAKMSFRVVRSFFDHPGFIDCLCSQLKVQIEGFDQRRFHILFSYHGVPVRQVRRTVLPHSGCSQRVDCCEKWGFHNQYCYRAQCFETSRLVAAQLGLGAEDYSVSFQSRLGRTPWIRPYTDEILAVLRRRGIKNLLVSCPSFVADCLETLEEIGIRAAQDWKLLGGDDLVLVPGLNSADLWVENVKNIVLNPDYHYPI
jgi:ferrochelatase